MATADLPETTILILGETGVGKSTWINAIYNYLLFDSLQDAEAADDIKCLIPASFSVTDADYNIKEVSVGDNSKNEVLKAGQSASQEPVSYVLITGGHKIRLIDTPSLGDPRGIEQDKKNMAMILQFVSAFKEINGICVLLKPNDSRVTVAFRFCVKELLKQLHRSAAANICFCFTNCRGTFYKPGNTVVTLKALLSELRDVKLETTKETMYCFDNESFRFLCAKKNGITFSDDDQREFAESWRRNATDTKRLFDHVQRLHPHRTADSVSLNNVRITLKMLAKPITDVRKQINRLKTELEDKSALLESQPLTGNDDDSAKSAHSASTFDTARQPQKLLKTKRDAVETSDRIALSQLDQLDNEQQVIIKIAYQLRCFLKQHALAQDSDAFGDYLTVLIEEKYEKCAPAQSEYRAQLATLQMMLDQHKADAEILERAIKSDVQENCLSIKQAESLINHLFNLPLNGAIIKETVQMSIKSRTENSECRMQQVELDCDNYRRTRPRLTYTASSRPDAESYSVVSRMKSSIVNPLNVSKK